MDSLEEALAEKGRKLEAAERKIPDLTAKLKFANKNRFGNKGQSSKKSKPENDENSDRNHDKDNFDDGRESRGRYKV